MIRKTFLWGFDEEHGTYGWIPTWFKHANAGEGLTVAHDALEHVAREQYLEGELQAFGAMYFIRGKSSWWANYIPYANKLDPVEIMGGAFGLIFQEFIWGNQTLLAPKRRTYRLNCPTDEEMIQAIVDRGWRSIVDEHGDSERLDEILSTENRRRTVDWLRIGFRKAERRYGADNYYRIADLFHQIMTEADARARLASEGDKLHVLIDAKNGEATVRHTSWEDEYASEF